MSSSKRTGERIVKNVFGATLADQGRGYYVGLELLALTRGTLDASDVVLPTPTEEPLEVARRSHDFIRRLMAKECKLSDKEREELGSETTFETLRALAFGLCVPVPGRLRRPSWIGEHVYPYVGELIHYDAAERKLRKSDDNPAELNFRINIERYTYRGAGGLAHRILREDLNTDRLEAIRAGMRKLVQDSQTPLGSLFSALGKRDAGGETEPFKETLENGVQVKDSRWTDILRDGLRNILLRDLPVAKKVEALMHWVPYCIARYQEDLAFKAMGETAQTVPVECGGKGGPVRRAAHQALDRSQAAIINALDRDAEKNAPGLVGPKSSRKWRDTCRSFFTGTLGSIGALNAYSGRRHYTLRTELLEAVVLANLEPNQEVTFEAFCSDFLHDRLGMVVDRTAAIRTPSLGHFDRSEFNENSQYLVRGLRSLGMLHEFSDTTRMVKGEVH